MSVQEPKPVGTGHIPTKEPEWRSKCHDATVHVVGSDEGTSHYECDQCGQACDFYDANAPLPSSTQKAEEPTGEELAEKVEKENRPLKEAGGKLPEPIIAPEATQNPPKDHS